MAYTRKPGDPQASVGTSQPALLDSSSPQTAGAAGQGVAPAAGAGKYVNLQDYLRLNQPQAQAMAQKVGGYVGNEGAAAQAQLNQAQGAFQQQMQAGMGTDILPQQPWGAANRPGTPIHGAYPSAPTAAQLDAYKQQAGQQYTGPNSLAAVTDVDALTQKATKAAQDAKSAGSFYGLAGSPGAQGLVGQVYGGNTTQGGANLDAFLTGASGGLSGLDAYKGLGDAIDSAKTGAVAQAANAAQVTKQRADAAQQAYTNGLQAQRQQQRTQNEQNRQQRNQLAPSTIPKRSGLQDPYTSRGGFFGP